MYVAGLQISEDCWISLKFSTFTELDKHIFTRGPELNYKLSTYKMLLIIILIIIRVRFVRIGLRNKWYNQSKPGVPKPQTGIGPWLIGNQSTQVMGECAKLYLCMYGIRLHTCNHPSPHHHHCCWSTEVGDCWSKQCSKHTYSRIGIAMHYISWFLYIWLLPSSTGCKNCSQWKTLGLPPKIWLLQLSPPSFASASQK